ncbi:MerR family transcriptional regulator [Nocardiopsis sp. B62]|uniref:MerR family transcriptional regulator n=1 Tax=Nocardiopsis sp. B62 TaxID=2824874 RepID=UPI001B3636FE|nr:MerR family transcriptional regulator [Nocardiopsis sp. B62]MBQ1080025.1 MerR family transcriptional regulator [Nocardiopsis sp. B62]
MLSSELAALAGVTVRTLRHYHQIGLLPEPPRSSGGYRRYDVGHLVRLLRITRMTSLGVQLSVLPSVLDDPEAAEELLDELDHQAAEEIERLTRRRADIAALRRSGTPPDLPPELSVWRPAPEAGTPTNMARHEHEQLVLAAHLLGPAAFGALFGGPSVPANVTARFYSLDADTPDDEVSSLVNELLAHVRPVVAGLTELPPLDARGSALLDQLNAQNLHPVQQRVLRQLQHRLEQDDS